MRSFDNLALVDHKYNGIAYGSNAVALGASHGGSYADVPITEELISGLKFDSTLECRCFTRTNVADWNIAEGSEIIIRFKILNDYSNNSHIFGRSAVNRVTSGRWYIEKEYSSGNFRFRAADYFSFDVTPIDDIYEIIITKDTNIFINGIDTGVSDDLISADSLMPLHFGHNCDNAGNYNASDRADMEVYYLKVNDIVYNLTALSGEILTSNGTETMELHSTDASGGEALWGVKEITTKSILYYNAETNGFILDVTIANPYVLNTSFSDLIKLLKVPIQADLDYLNANPEGLRRLWFGELIPELSFTKADIQDEPIWGNEGLIGGSTVSGITIQNYQESCRTTYENVNVGVSNLVCTQDAGGVLTGIAPPNTADFSGGATINTNFKPNLHDMTIKEVVSGNLEDLDTNGIGLGTFSERAEHRTWKTDGTYKIDNVLMGYTPNTPDPARNIILDDKAIIGHNDTVSRTKCQFKVYTVITTDEEDMADYEEWLSCSGIMAIAITAHPISPDRWCGFDNRSGVDEYGKHYAESLYGSVVRLHNFDVSNGACYIRLGEDEITQIPNLYTLTFNYAGYGEVTYTWDKTDGRYELIDQGLADFMFSHIGDTMRFKELDTFVAMCEIGIRGQQSSFTRGGDFEMFEVAGQSRLEYKTAFDIFEHDNMKYNESDRVKFLGGDNPTTDIVDNNQTGWMRILFTPGIVHNLEELTISGRPSASSTQFRFRFYDNKGNSLNSMAYQTVTTKITMPIGIEL